MTAPLPGVEPSGCPPECMDGHIYVESGVMPCQACRPARFAAWAGGHYAPGHDREKCPDCQKRRAGTPAGPKTTAPRRILS